MFFLWTSDSCPYRTNSASSRWPICVIPKTAYFVDPDGVNATLATATREIVASFNRLSSVGVHVRDFRSMGGEIVANRDLETICHSNSPLLNSKQFI